MNDVDDSSAGDVLSVTRLPVVGVMGSGTDEHASIAEPLGVLLARAGVHLLTGGGRGVMSSVARGFVSTPHRRGLSIGVLPGGSQSNPTKARDGYPNPWVEIVIRTHLTLSGTRGRDAMSRNHINVLSADCVIALPGGAGTRSEVSLAMEYGRQTIAYAPPGCEVTPFPDSVQRARDLDEIGAVIRELLERCREGTS